MIALEGDKVKILNGKVFVNGNMTAGTNTGNGKAKITWYGTEAPSS